MSSRALRIVVGLGNLVIAAVIPLALTIPKHSPLTTGQAYLLGVSLFVAVTVIEIWFLAERAFSKDIQQRELWEASAKLDGRLQEIRRLLHQVEETKVARNDLFVRYFDNQVKLLERSVRDAVTKREVRIDGTMLEVTTWLLESSFSGRTDDIFRAIHFTSDNAFFLGMHSRRYFAQVADLVSNERIHGVQRVLVDENGDASSDPCSQRIVDFHHDTKGYECRCIRHSTFVEILRDYELEAVVKDFGIYGNTYLYKGIRNTTDEIVGTYNCDPEDIARFIDCFTTIWETASPSPRSADPSKMTIARLFAEGPQDGSPTPTNAPDTPAPSTQASVAGVQ